MDNEACEPSQTKKFDNCTSTVSRPTPFFSFKKCCYFFSLFLLLIVAILGAVALLVFFVLRPRKPIFSLQALRLASFTLNTTSLSASYASSLVLLNLNVENPNKVGIRYSPSQLFVLFGGVPIGVVEVPKFYQPAHSKNVSVTTRLVFERVNISQIANEIGKELVGTAFLKLQITGDIEARLFVFSRTLPMIKVALDCLIRMYYMKNIMTTGVPFLQRRV